MVECPAAITPSLDDLRGQFAILTTMNISLNPSLSRRTFLRGAGVTLALPLLEAMLPVFGTASARAAQARGAAADGRHRDEHGHPAAVLLPGEGRASDYALDALPGEARGASQEHDRLLRRQPPGRDRRARGREVLPHRHAASRSAAASATGSRSTSSPPSRSATRRAIRRSCWR